MRLSKRLASVAGMVTPGGVLADIGTDHAYIPIYLVENHVVPRAIASDVNCGPLERAGKHIREYGLETRIETRISDGLRAFLPGEAQSFVIAGMGGALTVRILQEGADRLNGGMPELILQPQSEVPLVRAYLARSGFWIVREDMVFEEGKYYPMMKAVRTADGGAIAMDELQLAFGPALLKERHPVLHQFLLRERKTQDRILESLGLSGNEAAGARAEEIRSKIALTRRALRLYEA